MNIKNTDSISILIANSGNQKKYHPVSEFKADILADVEADERMYNCRHTFMQITKEYYYDHVR